MKKIICILAMIGMTFSMQAQAQFHDAEIQDVKGPVKKITQSMMGREQIITFTPEGKMQQEGMSDVVYDENGYVQSAKVSGQGMEINVSYVWENGKLKATKMNMMGREIVTTNNYDEQGVLVSSTINMGEQEMTSPYSDYKYDDHGNWISRKVSMMGRDMETTRTIEYYE